MGGVGHDPGEAGVGDRLLAPDDVADRGGGDEGPRSEGVEGDPVVGELGGHPSATRLIEYFEIV
ncbi:MAG: hypothetical protein JST08_11600 [Actinobacteria bacterium]|nr:hypothetical protein [Actinomycetota bacterium]